MPKADLSGLRRDASAQFGRWGTRAVNALRHLSDAPVEDLASTPREAVWERDQAVLYRYQSQNRTRRTPILLVMSLVTRPHVFDLRPGNSLVEDLLAAGFDVFLLDWGVPRPVDAANTLATYCDEYLPLATEAVLSTSGAEQVNVLGYCMGGTLSLLSVAGNPQMRVRNLVVLAAPLDFAELRPLPMLLGPGRLEPELVVDETGNVPAGFVKNVFAMIQPTAKLTTFASMVESTVSNESTAAHKALVGWSYDHIPFPGGVFTEVVHLLLRQRVLAFGRCPVGARTVELASISCPVLSVVGDNDNLIPGEATAPLERLLPDGAVETLHLPAGHAGLFVGRSARKRCVPSIIAWLSERDG
jgi:polyhydroxyalkanoate synthase